MDEGAEGALLGGAQVLLRVERLGNLGWLGLGVLLGVEGCGGEG